MPSTLPLLSMKKEEKFIWLKKLVRRRMRTLLHLRWRNLKIRWLHITCLLVVIVTLCQNSSTITEMKDITGISMKITTITEMLSIVWMLRKNSVVQEETEALHSTDFYCRDWADINFLIKTYVRLYYALFPLNVFILIPSFVDLPLMLG